MKLISMSDIHGDFETFDYALNYVRDSKADVLTINGDLSGSVLSGEYNKKFIDNSEKLRQVFGQIYNLSGGRINTFNGVSKILLSGELGEIPKELKISAENYLETEKIVRERMLQNYEEFKKKFDGLEQKVILVPGNWDGKCIDEKLSLRNIHNKQKEEVNGIGFIGYGSSNALPYELPQDLIVSFDEDEAFKHLSSFGDVDVAMTHDSPRGFEGNGNPYGKFGLRSYLFEKQPSLFLYGHAHKLTIMQEKGIVIANPGNLGRYKRDSYGTFLEIDIDENSNVTPIAKHMVNGTSINSEKF
ncbi:MAG: metallophosphoesterase family protein [Nanoarchaeota archaeon]